MKMLERFWRQLLLGLMLVCAVVPADAADGAFRKILLQYRDGHVETFTFGLAPFVLVADETVTIVFLKDKQVVPRPLLRAVCQDQCPLVFAPQKADTIIWDGRKPLETRGKILSDPSFAFVQDGKLPVKNALFERVRVMQFAE